MNRNLAGFFLRGWAVLAVVFLCSGAVRAADPPAKSRRPATAKIKILTWNIQMLPTVATLIGQDDANRGQKMRAPWIIDYLNRQDYDIVVLQETLDYAVTAQLKQGLKKRYPHIVAPNAKLGLVSASGGVLFAGRIPLRYVAHAVYQNSVDVDALAEKGCTLVEAETQGIRFQIAGTHLQAGHGNVRRKQFAEIYDKILKPYAKSGVPQFLAGDMNVESGTEEYRQLLKTTGMRDFTVNDARPYTVDAKNSWKDSDQESVQIDYVLLNPRGTETTVTRLAIQRAKKEHEGKSIDLSDHYGLVAEVTLKN